MEAITKILRAINMNTKKAGWPDASRPACPRRPESISNYALEDLVDGFSESLYKFCRSLTYSKEDADDLLQETFLKALEQMPKLNASDNPKSFLFSTALYVWKSWKRKYARRNQLVPVEPLSEQLADMICDGVSVEDSILSDEDTRIVREVVDSLPEKFKIPVILHYTNEMGAPEIAEVLGLPSGTVYSRLHKARKLIKKGLGDIGYEKY